MTDLVITTARRGHRSVLLRWLAAVFLIFAVVPATELSAADVPPWTLQMSNGVVLARIAPGELIGKGGEDVAVSVDDLRFGAPPVNTTIVRELPALWKLRLPPGHAKKPDVDVTIEVVSLAGRTSRMSLAADPASEVMVRVTPTGTTLLSAGPHETYLVGGAVLEIDISRTRQAGEFTGQLSVSVTPR